MLVSLQNSYVKIQTPKDDGIRKWGLCGTSLNGIIRSFIIYKAPESLRTLPPCEDIEGNCAGTLVF